MGVLQTLPDEVLLQILSQLMLDAFYCLVRTCRTFMRLGHDGYCRQMFERDCQPVLYFEDLERHYRHYRDVYAPGVSIYEHHQFSTSPFKPPGVFLPPWSPQGQITGQYRDSERFTVPMLATHDMTPHCISYNIHDYDNRLIAKIAALLLKDTLCSPCWEFRSKPAFHSQLQLLMRPLYCTGCQLYHARALFSQSAVDNGNYRHRLCIGWTGRIRICAHKNMTWREYTKDRLVTPYRCKPCKTKFTAAIIVSKIQLLDLSREQQGLDEQLDLVRAALERSDDMTCPHYPLNDPTIRTYLCYTIRRVLPSSNGQTQSFPFTKPLLDCWGKPWGCPVCKSAFSLHFHLTRATETSSFRTLLSLRLIVSRPLDKPNMAKPCDSRWLTQLEPSEQNRNDDAHGVTWCDDAACGTSKRRRKEALLFWLVETGVKAVPQPALSRASAAGREHWLWFAFWWFLRTDHMPPDGEDDHQPRQRWLRDLDKQGLYTKVMGGAYRNSTSGVGKADWRQAALQHALTLYDDGGMGDSLLKIKVLGHWKKYETYLKGERRRPLAVARDWLRGEMLLAHYLDQH